MLIGEKQLPNHALDFVMGLLSLPGLGIQWFRQREHEIGWAYFAVGFIISTLILMAGISNAIRDVETVVIEERPVQEVERKPPGFCHYDSMMDTSMVISGGLGSSETHYYSGNACR